MTIDTINYLKLLIAEKNDRLGTIERRLDTLRTLVQLAISQEELDAYQIEVDALGQEIKDLTEGRDKLRKVVNDFFKKPAA